MSEQNQVNPTDAAYNSLQTMTARTNAVREAAHLLDVCWHDLRVMLKYFHDANANISEIEDLARPLMEALTAKSDGYDVWVNAEQVKIRALMVKLGISE